jgi:pyridoxamine--pyruvate transaminase
MPSPRVQPFTFSVGPVTASPEALVALSAPIGYDYDPVYLDTYERTLAKVGELFQSAGDIVLMQGEALLGLEAAARGLVRPGTEVLNLVNGTYARLYGELLRALGARVHEIDAPDDDAIDPADVARALEQHAGIEVVAVVHCDSTAACNPIAEIGPLARSHGAVTIVDAVPTLGGMELKVDEWQLDVCVSAAHKCIGATPGLALMTVSDAAWARIEANPAAPRRSYLSLLDWRAAWFGQRRFPHTTACSLVLSLEAACDAVLREGLDASIARHALAARAARAGFRAAGLEIWARDGVQANTITAVRMPDGVTDESLRARMRGAYGVVMHRTPDSRQFRIGHMGMTASSLYPLVAVGAAVQSLSDLGVDVDVGAATAAVLAELAAADQAEAVGRSGA